MELLPGLRPPAAAPPLPFALQCTAAAKTTCIMYVNLTHELWVLELLQGVPEVLELDTPD